MRDVTKLPLRPFGKGAGAAADAMDAAGPAVGMVGDAVMDSLGPALAAAGGEIGTQVGMLGTKGASSLAAMVPGVGPGLAAAVDAGGTIGSQIIPRASAAGAQLAMQAPKIAGRAAYGLTSGGLRMMESDLGASKYGPAMSKALSQRAVMSIGGPSKPGGGMGMPEPKIPGVAPTTMGGIPQAPSGELGSPSVQSSADGNALFSDALNRITQRYSGTPQPAMPTMSNPGPFSETRPDPQDPRRFRPAGRRSAPF